MDIKLRYKIGDKFISLVEYSALHYGDLITVTDLPDGELPIICKLTNNNFWGFTEKSLYFATIPLNVLTEKELFVYTLAGIPPLNEKKLTEKQKRLIYHGK